MAVRSPEICIDITQRAGFLVSFPFFVFFFEYTVSVDLSTLSNYKYSTIQYKRQLGRARQAQSSNDSMTASGQW